MRITSRDNPIIKNLLKLHQAKRRRERGEYLVYGRTLCREALAAGVVATLLYTDERAWSESDFSAKLLVGPKVMAALSENATVEICAVCRIEQRPFVAGSDVVVLDGVRDPGNLGTILRSARAFGLNNVFCSDNCVDSYNIKVLRAAHGAHFALAMQSGDLEQYLAHSPNRLVTTYVDEPDGFRHDADQVYDIVFGNEGSGIRSSLKTLPRQNCRLDIDFESLNVAIAASIILYTTFRRLR